MFRISGFIAVFALFTASTASAESFNNDSIISLSSAGVDDAVLLAKIDSLPCSYNVGTDDIIRLKNAGVSNRVITAMVQRCIGSSRAQGTDDSSSDPLVKRRPGIYLWNPTAADSKLKTVRPTYAGGARVTGNGSILFPYVARLTIAQTSAQTLAPSASPVFYFYFEAADNKTGDFGTSESYAAQSPSEFALIKFKSDKGQREMTIGKVTAFNATVGIDPKNTIPIKIDEVGDGIFKVEVASPLKPGEYAFVIMAGSDKYRIYDFRVE